MGTHRAHRLAEEIKREIAQILQEEIKDPGIGFASITQVEVSNDLRHAKIHVSVLGSQEERQRTLAALQRANGFIRSEIARRIRLRYAPELSFKMDSSIEHGVRIAALLNEVRREEAEGPKGEND